jgi:competence protein ComEA
MPDVPRSHLVAYGLALLLVLGFGARRLAHAREAAEPAAVGGAPASIALESGADRRGGTAVVHVTGAVRRPGVYRLRVGARVDDAVRRAGGVRPRADLTQVNLAAKVEDGRQVIVPLKPRAAGAGGAADAGAGTGATTPGVPLNLNTATSEQLQTLDGVGPATAQKILDYRQAHGGFSAVDELGQVPGIGERRLAALREKVRV